LNGGDKRSHSDRARPTAVLVATVLLFGKEEAAAPPPPQIRHCMRQCFKRRVYRLFSSLLEVKSQLDLTEPTEWELCNYVHLRV